MEILDPSLKERLWHKMRADLMQYVPAIASSNVLMCCACGRFLGPEHFSLEHIIPRQALAEDPDLVCTAVTANVRSGNILLCTKPLKVKGNTVYALGCNSWKGRNYDACLRNIFNKSVADSRYKRPSQQHTIAALCAAYLGMVLEFGYQVALTADGHLMRRQFFSPAKYVKDMPVLSQMMLLGDTPPAEASELDFWRQPFSFDIQGNSCITRIRNYVIGIPVSRDPRMPIARQLVFAPSKFTLRPDFTALFS